MKQKLLAVVLLASALALAPASQGNGLLRGFRKQNAIQTGESTYLNLDYAADVLTGAESSSNVTIGDITADGGTFKCLHPTDGGAVSYVVYKISALASGNVISTLRLEASAGRFAYYAGDYGNNFDVYVSASTTFADKAYTVAGGGTALSSISADISTAAAALKASTLYVRFGFSPKTQGCGYDTTWTGFEKFALYGTESFDVDSEHTYLTRTFTTDGIADASSVNMAVTALGGEFAGIHPSDGGAVSSLTYEINVLQTGDTFQSLVLTLTDGRFAYYAGDYGFNFDVYVSASTTFTDKAYTVAGTGTASNTLSADLSTAVAALAASKVYVKFGFSPKTAGCGYDTSWSIFNTAKITGKEGVVADPTLHSYTLSDDWHAGSTGSTPSGTHNATSVSGFAGDGNTTHGAVVGNWGASLSVSAGQSGNVVYKIGREHEILTALTFKFTASFNSMGNNEMYWGDRMLVDASLDGVNYTNVATYVHPSAADAGVPGAITVSSSEYAGSVDFSTFLSSAGNQRYAYVRFTMLHALALTNIELGAWGMKMFTTSVNYGTKDGYFINYDLDGGTLPASSQYAFYPTEAVYTLPTPSKDGYVFGGWYSGENKVETFDPSAKSDINVKAKWTLLDNTHTVTYNNLKGADNSANPATYKDSDSAITLASLSLKGYTFLGFYDAETDGNKVTTIDPAAKPGDLVLYARWSENTYTITYTNDSHIALSAVGKEALPTSIAYTETLTFNLTPAEGYGISCVKVNGALIDFSDNQFKIAGEKDAAFTIETLAFEKGKGQSAVLANQDFTSYQPYDFSWGEEAYASNNLRITNDVSEGHGLCKIDATAESFIEYKFSASEGKNFSALKIAGNARIFDYNNHAADVTIQISSDGTQWNDLKVYTPVSLTDGSEIVSLAAQKALNDAKSVYYVKVLLHSDNNSDWVVLKSLGITFTEAAATPSSSSSSAPSSSSGSSASSSSSTTSTSSTPTTSSSTSTSGAKGCGGCGGAIGESVAAASLALGGIALLVLRKKKHD